MVEFSPHSSDLLKFVPQEFWDVTGYRFEEGRVWGEPTPNEFDDYRDSHEALVANMLLNDIPDLFAGEIVVPEFVVSKLPHVNLRGIDERESYQRAGIQILPEYGYTQVNFAYDLIRGDKVKGFSEHPDTGLYHDVYTEKSHYSKGQIFFYNDRNEILVGHQSYPLINRDYNEITHRIQSSAEILDYAHPFQRIKHDETALLLSKMAAYIHHHKRAA